MRRPWNIINVPVYSLATYLPHSSSMNICTYVSVISMQPKQYLIAVDPSSKTFENLRQSEEVVLQLLSSPSAKLVKVLGKKSGHHFDKTSFLSKKDLLRDWHGFQVLSEAAAYLKLDKIDQLPSAGDHELFIFELKKYKVNSENDILMFQDLVEQKIIL